MRTRWIIFLACSLVLAGYVLGSVLPLHVLSPSQIGVDITRNDYISRVLTGVGILATLLATCVALFKEDLLGLIRRAQMEAKLRDKEALSEQTVLEQSNDGTPGSSMVATKYEVIVEVSNTGKLVAKGCHAFLEKLVVYETGKVNSRDVFVQNPRLQWLNREGEAIHIPRGSRAFVTLVEFLSPQSSVVASGSPQASSQARLVVGQHEFGEVQVGGRYVAEFAVHSENASSVPFSVEFEWNGTWEKRLSEMKERVKVKAKGCDHGK